METSATEISVILVILLILIIILIIRVFIILLNLIIMSSSNRLAVRASRGRSRRRCNILKVCLVYTSLGPGVVGQSLIRQLSRFSTRCFDVFSDMALSQVQFMLSMTDVNVLAAEDLGPPRGFLELLSHLSP